MLNALRRTRSVPAAALLSIALLLLGARSTLLAAEPAWLPLALGQIEAGNSLDLAPNDSPAAPEGAFPDAQFNVPWEGVVWSTMPDFTWAACNVAPETRQAIDIAIGQWSDAASNQGLPIRLTEVPCDANPQIALVDSAGGAAAALDAAGALGATEVLDAQDQPCDVTSGSACVAAHALVVLFPDNWVQSGLSYPQAAKTVAHEIGHAVGLGHAHLCNFETVMAQNCEPILHGLGADDVQSLDALVNYDRAYFQQAAITAQPLAAAATDGGTVTYHAGWNLVAGPRGTAFAAADGPLFALLPNDTAYRSIPSGVPSVGGFGYWAYFLRETTVQLAGGGAPFYTANAPPGQWFLLGNDSASAPMRIYGATAALTYDPQSAQYVAVRSLQPGQAAWVQAGSQGEIGVGLASLTADQVNCYLQLGDPASC
jgi:hypothetical protein